jgi:asparagine synthase (glutamine-hydrolysing)
MKELAKKYLPVEIVDRPKHGFPAPVAGWLKGPLQERAGELFNQKNIERLGLLDYKTVRAYWQDFLSGNNYRARQLWTLFIWQLWSEKKL